MVNGFNVFFSPYKNFTHDFKFITNRGDAIYVRNFFDVLDTHSHIISCIVHHRYDVCKIHDAM